MVYSYRSALVDQTERALWSVKNVMDCIPDTLWERPYCGMPLWKHLYHMLHSLDQSSRPQRSGYPLPDSPLPPDPGGLF